MTPPDPALLEAANAEFYDSLEAADLDRMAAVWDHSDDVYCVHPGMGLIAGWGPVRRSWAAIFATGSPLQFIVTDVLAHAEGTAGWVTCTENILTARPDAGMSAATAVATNVFAWREGDWRMVAHHASGVARA